MIFPEKFEEKLGFDAIRHNLAENCLCTLGRSKVDGISFSSDLSTIVNHVGLTEEFRQILLFNEHFPVQDYLDLTGELSRVTLEGTFLEPEQLISLKLSLTVIKEILSFFRSVGKEKYPLLADMSKDLAIDKTIISRIEKIIDERGMIRDDASLVLRKIRKDKLVRQAAVEKKIRERLKSALKSGWTPEDAGITIRNGRLVIPMLAGFKRQIPGFIHDESATGQTVYLEPSDVVEINNEIKELDFAERREIIKILSEFTSFLRPLIPGLLNAYDFLGTIDYLRAKALFALEINACLPKIILDRPHMKWSGAVHPLLFLSHRRVQKVVVPLSIELTAENRILVISGPNAGGKSVCLKTVGLLQYMFQCGLLVPLNEKSEMGLFRNIFIDIGDEQSLENDLSTYTSKLLNLKFFIHHLDSHSLFLVDELGTGTDPSMGGTIAEASLEKINLSKAFGVVTTHYSNLKTLAAGTPGVINGAMLFDNLKMIPLYQLLTGKPGSSFALEIARQIGFPEDVLKNAENKTGKSQLDFDRQIRDLETEKSEISKKADEFSVADSFLQELINKYQALTSEIEKNRKEILQKAREEALELINKSNKQVEKTIREIRESQADKSRTKTAREELTDFKAKLLEDQSPSEQQITTSPPHHGTTSPPHLDTTTPPHHGTTVPLEQVTRHASRVTNLPTVNPYIEELNRKLQDFRLTLDIRGHRADEAFAVLQRYFDDAILLGIPEVRILHGKGNGILRQITREYLSALKEVKKFHDEQTERGGSGITVVTFY